MKTYVKNLHEKLKFTFQGSSEIEKNYSQAYQDMFVLSVLDGKKDGYFLEIGAFDATYLNNTYLLETEFNWKGISVDITKSSEISFLDKKRTSRFILSDALVLDYEKIFIENGFPTQIDYLQLDIEPQAQTLNCLKKLPLDKYRFSVITFETDFYDPNTNREESIRNREESRSIFKEHGYELIVGNVCNVSQNDPFEDWYVDPTVIDMEKIKKFKESTEYNNTSETYMLNL